MDAKLSLDAFWRPAYSGVTRLASNTFPTGWETQVPLNPYFIEPELILRAEIGCSPEDAQAILIAAPGAVGKSTFAKALCSQTGLVYVDLPKRPL